MAADTKQNTKQTNTSTILAGCLIVAGIAVIAKNHKRDGFWAGLGAGFLLFGVSIKIYK